MFLHLLRQRRWVLLFAWVACSMLAQAQVAATSTEDPTGGDPLGSMQWPGLQKEFLADKPVVFDKRVVVTGPQFAEDAQAVAVQIDAQALARAGVQIQRMVVLVDRNPIRKVLEFEPVQVLPTLTFRFKLEQSSPVRLAVLGSDGQWHVGSSLIEASGGGCTVPGESRKDGSWSQTLNQVQSRFFPALPGMAGSRLRLRIMHPMDTGLANGIPALYLQTLSLTDAAGQVLWVLHPHEPVSENPIFSFDFARAPTSAMHLAGVDNNGNRLDQDIAP